MNYSEEHDFSARKSSTSVTCVNAAIENHIQNFTIKQGRVVDESGNFSKNSECFR